MEHIISTAVHPVEDMSGTADDPCLLVTIRSSRMAIQLFRHIMQGQTKSDEYIDAKCDEYIDAPSILLTLNEQGMTDRRVC